MNPEQLVPPLKLCKQIPRGAFANSALVWWGMCVYPRIHPDGARYGEPYRRSGSFPAPTLAEILEEIDPSFDANITVTYHFGQWKVEHRHYPREGVGSDNDNPATAALKLWLEVNRKEE